MASVADSTTATTSRPLRLRLRPDLQMRRHFYLNQPRWVIKDPVGLSYFQVHQEEYDVLRLLDGKRSLEDIKEEFERAHAPQMITYQDIQQFVGQAHRSGLVISTAPGQGDQLWLRRRKQRRKKIMSGMLNVFWLRFRGVDPTWVLNRFYPWTARF